MGWPPSGTMHGSYASNGGGIFFLYGGLEVTKVVYFLNNL
jgi:hypothetical protein